MVSSRDLPNLEIKPSSPALQAIGYPLCHQGSLDSIPERTGSFQCGANEAFLKIFIYLTALGLSHSMWIFSCSIWDLVPWPGNPGALHWELRVLVTGPPGKFCKWSIFHKGTMKWFVSFRSCAVNAWSSHPPSGPTIHSPSFSIFQLTVFWAGSREQISYFEVPGSPQQKEAVYPWVMPRAGEEGPSRKEM